MFLAQLIANIDIKVDGEKDIDILGLAFHTDDVRRGYLFVAILGQTYDGNNYIEEAISKGAIAVLSNVVPVKTRKTVTYLFTTNIAVTIAEMSCNFYNAPSKKLKLIGVTGTCGKTSTVHFLYSIIKNLGYKVGLISTVVNNNGKDFIPSKMTTPDCVTINKLLKEMVNNGCEYCFMEVSSHGIDQKRIHGLFFFLTVFLNISHDHLDYHKTFLNYINVKKIFFDNFATKGHYTLVNSDDKHAKIMIQNTQATIKTFALYSMADFSLKIVNIDLYGMELKIENEHLFVPIIGEYNAYNILAAYSVCRLLGLQRLELLKQLSSLKPVKGRNEFYKSNKGVIGVVDYAHKPEALSNLLDCLSKAREKQAKMIIVIGCGGNRDTLKRPKMGNVATKYCDIVIFTSDNPRDEDPKEIIQSMLSGVEKENVHKVLSLVDRQEAIQTACHFARTGDLVIVAGKGHEIYQEIKGKRIFMDDSINLCKALAE